MFRMMKWIIQFCMAIVLLYVMAMVGLGVLSFIGIMLTEGM